ncbi:argininosuccinate lyase [Candidatus Saccharibacteria bacterium]|nr:argininosuccinate lyase [Candidatus Saccharibacteria bacterium]
MTTKKLWQVDDGSELHPVIERYTVDDDQILDQELLGYDITATKAHAHMLQKIGILSKNESNKISETLDELLKKWQSGQFKIAKELEDGHSAIELYLTEKLGGIGKKVHTGRSRNDQALVMMRLFLKDKLKQVSAKLSKLDHAYLTKIKSVGDQPMPGYTHTQKAMPASVGMWLGAYQQAFTDTEKYIESATNMIDQNPLGSAAGFGVTLPLDREFTTKELGFQKVQDNPMYCGMSRGVFELIALQSLSPIMIYAGKFATDMIQFTMQELKFFALPDSMTTGSSIMPQKRNYDVFEIIRARAHEFPAHLVALQNVVSGVGSGYHRDLQITKSTTLIAFSIVLDTIEALTVCVENLRVNSDNLNAAMTDDLYAVAKINKLVEQGVPFRDAYQQVKKGLK